MTEAQRRQAELEARPFKHRKAALNLAQMVQGNAELNPDRVTNLIDTLTVSHTIGILRTVPNMISQAEAPVEVEKLLEAAEKDKAATEPVSEQERKDLLALIALAQKRLGA